MYDIEELARKCLDWLHENNISDEFLNSDDTENKDIILLESTFDVIENKKDENANDKELHDDIYYYLDLNGFHQCDRCGSWFEGGMTDLGEPEYICRQCLEDNYVCCDRCGEWNSCTCGHLLIGDEYVCDHCFNPEEDVEESDI